MPFTHSSCCNFRLSSFDFQTLAMGSTWSRSKVFLFQCSFVPSCNSSRIQFSLKGPSSVSAVRPAVQLYASYEGHMIVWDFKLPERGNDDPSSPLPCLPSRIKSVFKVNWNPRDSLRSLSTVRQPFGMYYRIIARFCPNRA